MVKRNTFSGRFKKLDLFAKNIAFREDGGDQFGSVFGALISLMVALVVAAYCLNKFLIMKNYEDTQFNNYSVKNGLSTERFGNDQLQLQIAFSAFENPYDEESYLNSWSNKGHEQYIDYVVTIWTNSQGNWTL